MSKYNEFMTGLDQNLLNNMQNYLDTVTDTAVKKEPELLTKRPSVALSSEFYSAGIIDGRRLAAARQVIDSIDLKLSAPLLEKLLVPGLNIYTHAAFLFLLEQEGLRSVRRNAPLTVVLFKVRQLSKDGRSYLQLPTLALKESIRRIKDLKREADILCQYENEEFAVILPDTNRLGGEIFACKAEKALQGKELMPGLNYGSLKVSLGVASSGKYCQSLELLLGAAESALRKAETAEKNIFVHREPDLESTGLQADQCPRKMPDLLEMQLLSKEMISEEYKIFTYPAMLLRLERELQKAGRNKHYLAIILLKICKINSQGETSPLPRGILQTFLKAIGQNLRATDALGFFGDGNFIILTTDNSLSTMNDVTKKTIDTIKETNLKEYLIEPSSLAVETKILAVRKNYNNPQLIDLVSI